MFQNGLLIVVSGPSGSGKSTLLRRLKEKNAGVKLSVSATTRKPRNGEVEGKNYFFKTYKQFESMIEKDELVEWAEYCDNYYGTPKRYVEDCLKSGNDVVLEIEVIGNRNIKKKYPACVSIFVLPPSYAELKRRIKKRGTENKTVIDKRLEKARKEMKHVSDYDYVVVNDDIEKAVDNINSILKAEKMKYKRNNKILNVIGIEEQEEWNKCCTHQ